MKASTCHPDLPIKAHGLCRFCYNKQYRLTNKERESERHKAWWNANYCRFPEKLRDSGRTKLQNPNKKIRPKRPRNPDSLRQDPEITKLKLKLAVKRWREENPGRGAAIQAKRRASKLQRTPSWANNAAIKRFYLECPPGMTVDHVIPLQGKNVSGLHVEYNLQYLSPVENSTKNNRFEI